VFGANAIERRHAERRGPGFKKRIVAHSTSSVGFPGS
jgi:hypothetical protein